MKVGEKKEIKNLLFLYGMPCWLLSCCSQISQTSNAATPRNIYILNLADNRYTVALVWDISELGFYGFDWNKITFCNWKGQNTMSLAVLAQFSSVHCSLVLQKPYAGNTPLIFVWLAYQLKNLTNWLGLVISWNFICLLTQKSTSGEHLLHLSELLGRPLLFALKKFQASF